MMYLGIDVAKAKLDCMLFNPDSGKHYSKVVSNDTKGFAALLMWLRSRHVEPGQVHVVMEATGVYHESAALCFSDAGLRVSVINPAQMRHYAQGLAVYTKTDKVDSLVIARYGAMVQPPAWQAPAPNVRQLKALVARLQALQADEQRELNRREKTRVACEGELVEQSLQRHLTYIGQEIQRVQQAIGEHIDKDPDLKTDYKLLVSIPAVGDKTAIHMLSIMHCHHFDSAEQLAAFLGLYPVQQESGSSVHKRSRMAKNGNGKVRAVLYMASLSATRCNAQTQALYTRLCAKAKPKMVALGAVMRKLVHQCFGVIKHQTPYRADWNAA